MRYSGLLAGLCLASVVFLGGHNPQKPVSVIPSGLVNSMLKSNQKLLFEENGFAIMRHQNASDLDFANLYVVRMPGKTALPFFAERLGEVIHFEPGQFAIMRVEDLYKVETLSHLMHHEGIACGALMRLEGDQMTRELVGGAGEPVVPVADDIAAVHAMAAEVSEANIFQGIRDLSAITTRFHSSPTGKTVADFIAQKYLAMADGREDVKITTFDHGSKTAQKSLVVRIEGRSRPEELVILGSHIDSVNWQNGSGARSPGADDNASGTATNMEVFRVMMASGFRPERTIEIHGYAAEEIGLVGSQDMAQKYKAAGKNVITMVQHDMNLYKAAGAPDKIWFVTNNSVETFNNALGSLIDKYVGVAWEKKGLSGGDSDHTSWRRQGFVTSFPFEDPAAYNRNIHTGNDSLESANAGSQAAAFAKLGLAYFSHYAGGEAL
jgi:leucyl aminopeptidase